MKANGSTIHGRVCAAVGWPDGHGTSLSHSKVADEDEEEAH